MRITYGQMTSLLTLTLIVQIYVFAPSFMAQYTEQNLWISLFTAIATSMLISWIMLKISLFFAGDTFIVVLQKTAGKYIGTAVGFLYLIYFFVLFMIHAQLIVTTFKTLFLPGTPIYATLTFVLIFAFYCSVLGIEVLARASNMVLLLLTGVILVLILAVIPEVKIAYLQPIIPQSIFGFWYGTLIPFASYGQVILLSNLFPFVNYKKEKPKTKKIFLGILGSYLLTSVLLIEEVGVFSAVELQKLQYPTVALITLIQIGEFMERLEIFLVTMWAGAVLLVVGIFFTTTCFTCKHILKIHDESKLANILLIIIGFTVIVWLIPDTAALTAFLFTKWIYLSLIFQAVLPVFLGIIFFIRIKVMKHVPD